MSPRKDGLHPRDTRRPGISGAIILLLIATAAGCSGIFGLGGDRLDSNLDRWRANRPAAYRFVYRNRCFCAGTEPVVVTVEGDSVVDVSPVDGSGSPPLPEPEYRTVEGLFAQLREWRDRDPADSRIEFHDRLGYPTEAFFDFRRNVADEEQGFEVTDLRALQPLQ